MTNKKARVRLGMVGGGKDAFIGSVHRIAARIDDRYELLAGALSSTPEKSLLRSLKRKGGRNVHGRITCRHRGGGHKRHYRVIDFKRDKVGIPAKVASVLRVTGIQVGAIQELPGRLGTRLPVAERVEHVLDRHAPGTQPLGPALLEERGRLLEPQELPRGQQHVLGAVGGALEAGGPKPPAMAAG